MPKLATVLLVDDDPTTTFMHQLLLQKMGVAERLLVAENGMEALHTLTQTCAAPDAAACPVLILLDVNMPVMGGIEFLEAFQQLPLHYVEPSPRFYAHDLYVSAGAGAAAGLTRRGNNQQTADPGEGHSHSPGALSGLVTDLVSNLGKSANCKFPRQANTIQRLLLGR